MFGSRVTGFAQDDDGVTAEILRDGAAETIRARFLIGADGARSTIRDILALPFRGETFPETTVLATTTFPFEDHLEGLSNVSYCWKDGGNFSLLKVPGRWRVSIYPREDLPIEQQLTPQSIEANLQEIVPSDTPYEVGEQRAYRVHQRIVHTYRIGRVALVGDAAHINSPSGGMGLNCGIHDAFELNETLTAILRGGASLALLDRYDRRRRPIAAEHIIAQSGNNRARMRERDLQKRTEILHGLQAITRDPEALHAYLLKSSMIAGLKAAAEID
jgi:3-(3-hydroxy-phenyl)propionate hydroxylase